MGRTPQVCCRRPRRFAGLDQSDLAGEERVRGTRGDQGVRPTIAYATAADLRGRAAGASSLLAGGFLIPRGRAAGPPR